MGHGLAPSQLGPVLDVVDEQRGVVQARDDGLDLRHFLGRDFEPHVERVDQGASDVFAGRLACVSRVLASRRWRAMIQRRRGATIGLCTASR